MLIAINVQNICFSSSKQMKQIQVKPLIYLGIFLSSGGNEDEERHELENVWDVDLAI